MKRLLVIPILLVFLSILIGGHVYLVDRLVDAPALPRTLATVLRFCVYGLAATLVLQPIAERLLPRAITRFVAWPAALWMGLAFLLLIATFGADLLSLLVATARAGEASRDPSGSFDWARLRAAAVLGLVLPAFLFGLRRGLAKPALRVVRLELERWPEALAGYTILQISDIHIGSLLGRDFARWLVARVNAEAPDLIAVTGDLVDGSVEALRDEVRPFAELAAEDGVFFVTGNHDHYSGARSWTAEIASLGMRVLRNEHVEISRAGARFVLAGVDDHRSGMMPGEGGEDLDRALEGIDPALPVVLLAHDPSTFKQAHRRGIDLQLSGHTHGGQIWPFQYFVRLVIPFVAELHRRGPAQLWVSRGTGFWGPPLRIGAPAEITRIEIRPASPRVE